MDFCVIGHRGGAGHAPENTLAAFESAVRLGLSDVELDVRLSRDGELVLFHDALLDHKTPLSGRVEEHAAKDLLAADIGHWFDAVRGVRGVTYAGETLTTLGRVLSRFGTSLRYHVELKGAQPELPERVVEQSRAFAGVRVVLTSFAFDRLLRVRELDPGVPLCWLLRDPVCAIGSLSLRERDGLIQGQRDRIERAAAAGFEMVGVRASVASREVVVYARSLGLAVRAWGVDTDEDVEHALAADVEGMTVDWPLEAIRRVRARVIEGGKEP